MDRAGDFTRPKKTSRVHGTIQRPVCMRTFALRRSAPDERPVARHRRFSACDGSQQPARPQRTNTLPEPESRYGLSLAHNDAFATIARSMFLACTFAFHVRNPREPVRLPAPSLRSVSRPNRGDVNARNPFSAPLSNTPNSSPISTPLQAFFRKPSGSKRSTGSKPGSSSHQTSDCPVLPAASSCDSAADQCLKLAPSELDLSFRKPWN